MQIEKINKEKFPFQLKQISQLPPNFDIIGKMPSEENKFLCIIGSRAHSVYGAQVVDKLISGLQGYPIVIVSGLAPGIDSLAHKTALQYDLNTIAFPGCGLSPTVMARQSHYALAQRIILHGGALLSRFERDQIPTDWTFPARNRLMAGISHAVLIIEAGKKSGTMITANFAADFGRDILAVPGDIFSPHSYGPNMLIRNGAIPITSSEDIVQALGFDILKGDTGTSLPNFTQLSLSPLEREVLDHLKYSAMTSTELMLKTDVPSTQLNIVISELELRSLIREENGSFRLA